MKNTEERGKSTDEVVDLELNCLFCGTRLYASITKARDVVAVVQSGGIVVLICPYGHTQSIHQKRQKTRQ